MGRLAGEVVDMATVAAQLKQLEKDRSSLDESIEREVERALRRRFPKTYATFAKDNQEEIEQLKSELREKYLPKIEYRIALLEGLKDLAQA